MARGESSKKKKGRSNLAGRAIGLLAFLPLASRAPLYARLMFSLVVDDRTPAERKALLAAALGYLVVGRDFVPDSVPLLGGLDDLVVVVLAVDLFLDGVPDELLSEKLAELGIDRQGFDDDVARIRRLTPAPLRKTIRRVPALIGQVAEAIDQTGVGPRVRGWINTSEESHA